MTINWNGAELNLGSLAALAAITFINKCREHDPRSSLLDKWPQGEDWID